MDFSADGDFVLSVSLGQSNQWHVSARDVSHPLASFDEPQAACAWAIAVARPKRGKVLVEELAASSPATSHSLRSASEAFKFSIPVASTDSRNLRFESARLPSNHRE